MILFLVVDTRSVETTIVKGQNMQICHSRKCKWICQRPRSIFHRTTIRSKAKRNTLQYTSAFLRLILVAVSTYVTESLKGLTLFVEIECDARRVFESNLNKAIGNVST